VLLLDEPVAGVPEGDRRQILDTVDALPAEVAVVLIEHDMDLVMAISDRVVVLHYGKKIAEGKPREIAGDPAVIDAYLGGTDN